MTGPVDLPAGLLLLWTPVIFWALGQIWLAQVVVYPLFARVGPAGYVDYHRFYTRRIPLPVILPGFASFLLPAPLALFGPPMPWLLSATNIAGGLVALAVTVALEIPRHNRLERDGKDNVLIAELVRFNWPRTVAITIQAAATILMLAHVLAAR